MAIEKDYYEPRLDVTVNDCYWKVVTVSGDKHRIWFKVAVYRNKARADLGHPVISESEYDFIPDLNGGNFIAQAYEHLKGLEEFNGCKDV